MYDFNLTFRTYIQRYGIIGDMMIIMALTIKKFSSPKMEIFHRWGRAGAAVACQIS